MEENLAHHEYLKYRLRLSGTTMAALARELGINHASLICITKRRRRSKRIEQALADKLNVPVDELFNNQGDEQT